MSGTWKFYDTNEAVSLHAIGYACDLTLLDAKNIRERLYAYGRIPLSPFWMHRFPREQLLSDALTGGEETLTEQLLQTAWLERPAHGNNNRWRVYYNRNEEETLSFSVPYKLYVNLHPNSLIREFNTIIRDLASYNVPVFKFAKDVYNIVRPDKFVAYLSDFETLLKLGESLSNSLKDAKVQLLPFTAALDSKGTISCGFDPPRKLGEQLNARSWRGFITQTITQSLKEGARLKPEKENMLKYTLEKIAALGIDTSKWLPNKIV